VTGDVFEKYPFGLHFSDDAGNLGPEVALVGIALALSCLAERLAGIAGEDGVDCAPEWSTIKGGEVVPDCGRGEISGPLGCDKDRSGVFLPFDKAPGVKAWFCKHEAKIKATAACAEGQSVFGT